ncbi:MAG: DUF5777 family beta-barrel protein [Melioribacteraceae bacterium]
MKFIILLLCTFVFVSLSFAQPKWKKKSSPIKLKLEFFHATKTANFPTTESLKSGTWMYEISHRFLPSIKDGYDALFGFDGPAKIRFALGYGINDNLMVTLGRSNNTDNLDLQFKQKLFQIDNNFLPSVFSLQLGAVWNTEVPTGLNLSRTDARNFQFYAQLVFNTMLFNKKLGIGIVPSYLHNSFIYAVDQQYSFTLGTYLQYYLNRMWSFWLEYNPTIAGYRGVIRLDETGKSFNTVAFGTAIETGGHIFHILITNNARLNTSQYLVGADRSANDGEWRLGFGIVRYF